MSVKSYFFHFFYPCRKGLCVLCIYMLKYQQYGYNYIAVMLLYTGGRRQLAALCLRRALVKENRK